MAPKPEKPALFQKCDELEIEYKSTDSIDDLKKKIADKIVGQPAVEKSTEQEKEPEEVKPEEVKPAEQEPEPTPDEKKEEEKPAKQEPVEPKLSKFIEGKFVENAPVLSANFINGYMEVQTTVARYKMSEEEYENLKATNK